MCFECKFFQNYMLYIFELFLLSIHTFVLSFLTSHLPGVLLFSSLSLLCPFLPGPSSVVLLGNGFFYETHIGSQFPSSGPLRLRGKTGNF